MPTLSEVKDKVEEVIAHVKNAKTKDIDKRYYDETLQNLDYVKNCLKEQGRLLCKDCSAEIPLDLVYVSPRTILCRKCSKKSERVY